MTFLPSYILRTPASNSSKRSQTQFHCHQRPNILQNDRNLPESHKKTALGIIASRTSHLSYLHNTSKNEPNGWFWHASNGTWTPLTPSTVTWPAIENTCEHKVSCLRSIRAKTGLKEQELRKITQELTASQILYVFPTTYYQKLSTRLTCGTLCFSPLELEHNTGVFFAAKEKIVLNEGTW